MIKTIDRSVGIVTLKDIKNMKFELDNVWKLDRKLLTINYDVFGNGQYVYEIDLEKIHSYAHIMSWMLQIKGKRWCDFRCLYDLFEMFHTIFNLRSDTFKISFEKYDSFKITGEEDG